MKEQTKISSVMIVDDHPLYSDAISRIIQQCTKVRRMEIASSMSEAIGLLAKRFSPQIIFLDLNLPDVTGISGFLALQKRNPEIPVVVISATNNQEVVQLVHDAGAVGYIPKNLEKKQLEQGIASIFSGERFFPSLKIEVKRFGSGGSVGAIDENTLHSVSSKLSQLTPQQSRILQMICAGMLNKQIAYELSLAEATVKTHITALMRKLGVQNRTQAALLVRDAMSAANLE